MMRKLKILSRREERQIGKLLEKQYGAQPALDYVFLSSKSGRLYVAARQAVEFLEHLRADSVGLYFGRITGHSIRLSIEGSQLVGPHAKKGVARIGEAEKFQWMMGESLPNNSGEEGYVVVASGSDFLGSAKASRMLLNHYSKSRRLGSAFQHTVSLPVE